MSKHYEINSIQHNSMKAVQQYQEHDPKKKHCDLEISNVTNKTNKLPSFIF
jgi:hypothetical protein